MRPLQHYTIYWCSVKILSASFFPRMLDLKLKDSQAVKNPSFVIRDVKEAVWNLFFRIYGASALDEAIPGAGLNTTQRNYIRSSAGDMMYYRDGIRCFITGGFTEITSLRAGFRLSDWVLHCTVLFSCLAHGTWWPLLMVTSHVHMTLKQRGPPFD